MNHRNMSSEHIFLKPIKKGDTEGPLMAMLGNYGNAIIQKSNAATKATSTLNDPYYMSPENVYIYRNEDSNAIKPGKKSDIYALGVLLLEICNLERMGEDFTNGVPLYENKDGCYDLMVK